jgi:hypothetical protein
MQQPVDTGAGEAGFDIAALEKGARCGFKMRTHFPKPHVTVTASLVELVFRIGWGREAARLENWSPRLPPVEERW